MFIVRPTLQTSLTAFALSGIPPLKNVKSCFFLFRVSGAVTCGCANTTKSYEYSLQITEIPEKKTPYQVLGKIQAGTHLGPRTLSVLLNLREFGKKRC